MATAHRQKRVLATCAAVALTLPLSGCLDAVMGSSDRGADAPSELETSVDSAYLVPTYIASCEIQAGDSGVLRFTATNTRITETERLLSVTTPAAADIRFEPPLPVDIPPEQTVAVSRDVQGAPRLEAVVQDIDESTRTGEGVEVFFEFEKSGVINILVPVEACPTQVE